MYADRSHNVCHETASFSTQGHALLPDDQDRAIDEGLRAMKVNIVRHRLDTGKGYSAYEIMQALVSATGLCSPHNANDYCSGTIWCELHSYIVLIILLPILKYDPPHVCIPRILVSYFS